MNRRDDAESVRDFSTGCPRFLLGVIVGTRSARYWNFYEGVLIGSEGFGWNSFWKSTHLDALIKFYLCFMRVAYFSLVEREEFKFLNLRKGCYIIAYVRVV